MFSSLFILKFRFLWQVVWSTIGDLSQRITLIVFLIWNISFWITRSWGIQIFFAEFLIKIITMMICNSSVMRVGMYSTCIIMFGLFQRHSYGILSHHMFDYMIFGVDTLWFTKLSFCHNTILKNMQWFLSGRHEKVLQFLLIICLQTFMNILFLQSFYGPWTFQECLTSFEYLHIIHEIFLDTKFQFLFSFPLVQDCFHLCCILCRSLYITNSNSSKLCRHYVGLMVKYFVFYNNEWRNHIQLALYWFLSFLGRVGGQTKFRVFFIWENQDWPMLVIFNELSIHNFLLVLNLDKLFLRIIMFQRAKIIHQWSFSVIHKRFRSTPSKYEVVSSSFRFNNILLFLKNLKIKLATQGCYDRSEIFLLRLASTRFKNSVHAISWQGAT